jgi:hypothetical protein
LKIQVILGVPTVISSIVGIFSNISE